MAEPPLEGRRISLRPMTAALAEGAYVAWMNDPEIVDELEAPKKRYTAADLVDYIAQMAESPTETMLAIHLNEDGRHIGNIKLTVAPAHERGSIGIIIGEKALWGRGYATEAIALLTEHAFADLGLMKLTGGCFGSNPGSANAFLKVGYEVEARRAKHFRKRGRWDEGVFLGLLNPARRDEP